jgi:tRNA1Val (adenine37-N6)-methyltransferase
MITPGAFRFKQFSIDDSRCAMKVGTDAVILGAWVNISAQGSILDIGTGCGIIALMAAQRSNGHITAIEIDEHAALQSKENFEYSPWSERIDLIHGAVQQFKPEKLFDQIISNPPFFKNALKAPEHKRNIARHNDSLSFESLLFSVDTLLTENGTFAFILPKVEALELIMLASAHQFYLNRYCTVFSREGKSPNRIMAEVSRHESAPIKEMLCIRNSKNQYTAEYKELTKDFYLFLSE